MINQMDNVNLSDFFQINYNNTRGHEYKFQKTRARLDIRKYSFSSRVVNEWNNLSMEAVQSTTLNGSCRQTPEVQGGGLHEPENIWLPASTTIPQEPVL